MSDAIKIAGLVLLAVLLIVIGPLITIWSLNTLFGLTIAYTIWTWLATAWLSVVTFGNVSAAIRNKKN
jgi:hypothetical protein